MITRDGQSKFVDSLIVGKRGTIRVAQSCVEEKQVDTKEKAHDVFDKFDKSPDIEDAHIKEHKDRLDKGDDPKEVVGDFFKGLQDAKKSKNTMTIKTAKLLRQNGIFKVAEKSVYQDLQSGDFWKISEDGKNVVRMFKENNGVTDGVIA